MSNRLDIKTLRILSGMTQFGAARRAQVSRMHMSLVECGEIDLPPDEEKRIRAVLINSIKDRLAHLENALALEKQ